jgi:hypothetical protein
METELTQEPQTQEVETKKSKTLKERLQSVGDGFKKAGKRIAFDWDYYDCNRKLVTGALIAAAGFGYIVGMEKFVSQPMRERRELSEARQEVLFRYGDSNKDGYVSQAEEDALFAEILSGKGVRSIPGERPFYEGGTAVPRSELTSWIKEYMDPRQSLDRD